MIGIYKIENTDNHKIYIGQSINIQKRLREHYLNLKANRHENSHLQRSWNIHGEDNFNFSIIEECKEKDLSEREIYWISHFDSYSNGYNATTGGEGKSTFTEELVKPVCDMFNNIEKNPVEIAKYFNIEPKKVRRYLYFGNRKGMCNYIPRDIKKKKIICITTNKVFDSLKDAHEYYNIANITASCNHKLNYVGVDKDGTPLIWLYYDEYESMSSREIEEYIKEIMFKIDWRVICLDTKQIFQNVYKAAEWCGLKTHQTILKNCKKQFQSAGRHPETGEKIHWQYYKDYIKDNNIQDYIEYKLDLE